MWVPFYSFQTFRDATPHNSNNISERVRRSSRAPNKRNARRLASSPAKRDGLVDIEL
jgi:hypothetical protein